MTKKFLKNRSKRQSCRQKYKVAKKVREHLRKVRKEAKNNPKRKKKDPGIPNSMPFKAEVLLEAEQLRQANKDEKRQLSQLRKDAKLAAKSETKSLQKLVANAEFRQRVHEKLADKSASSQNGGVAPELLERSAKAFHREFSKVVAESDVILEVLDARDPIGSRCRELESTVLAQPRKRLVLVLNKADLVPRSILLLWIEHLRKELPCIAFRCSTQSQKSRIGRSGLPATADAESGSRAAGVAQLMQLLANYCRNSGIKTSISVGIVGYPNTGKSSLINSLKRCKACAAGATPGLTRCSQSVQLDKRIRLLDCPGIVLASGASDTQLILRNCVRIETVIDPTPAVAAIISRCPLEQLMVFYNVAKFSDANEFLVLLAKRIGRLRRGGLPDVVAAGRKVLHDWVAGRITYYTMPPEQQQQQQQQQQEEVKLVSSWAKEFDLDSLELVPGQDQLELKRQDALDAVVPPMEPVAMATEDEEGQVSGEDEEGQDVKENEDDDENEDEDDEVSMEEEEGEEEEENSEDERLVVEPSDATRSGKRRGRQSEPQESDAKFTASMSRLQRNRTLRQQAKQMKRKAKKLDRSAAKLGGEFADKMDAVLDTLMVEEGEAYDFGKHFPPKSK